MDDADAYGDRILGMPGRSLRICLVSMEYPPSRCGGIGNWTHTLAGALVRRGHDVSVITVSPDAMASRRFEDGVAVSRIVVPAFYRRCQPPLPPLHPLLRDHVYAVHDEVVRLATTEGLDIVSVPLWNVEGLALLHTPPLCTVLTLHTPLMAMMDDPPAWVGSSWFPLDYATNQAAAERNALLQAREIIANSQAIVDEVSRVHGISLHHAEVAIVPHGIEDPPGACGAGPSGGDSVNVLFVGRQEPRKGIDTLLEVIPHLAATFPQVTFTIVGEELRIPDRRVTYGQAFRRRHVFATWKERVLFTGFVDEEEKQRRLRACDIFVAPSRFESFGLVYLEAMRCAKPVIGCRTGGAATVIDEGVVGELVPPGDAAALRAALTTLIVDNQKRLAYGRAARKVFLARYTADRMAETFETTLRGAIGRYAAQ